MSGPTAPTDNRPPVFVLEASLGRAIPKFSALVKDMANKEPVRLYRRQNLSHVEVRYEPLERDSPRISVALFRSGRIISVHGSDVSRQESAIRRVARYATDRWPTLHLSPIEVVSMALTRRVENTATMDEIAAVLERRGVEYAVLTPGSPAALVWRENGAKFTLFPGYMAVIRTSGPVQPDWEQLWKVVETTVNETKIASV